MEGFEDRDELVGAGQLVVAGIAVLERDLVLDPVPARFVRALHGGLVEVEAVDGHLRVARAMAMLDQPAPHATSATRAGGSATSRSWTSSMEGGHAAPRRLEKTGRLASPWASRPSLAEVLPDTPPPAPERSSTAGRTREDHAEARERRHVGERVTVAQDFRMPGGQAEPPLGRIGADVVDLEDPGDGLLLEPLAGVALGRAGRGGQLRAGRFTVLGERPVVAQAVAQVDGHELVGAQGGAEEPLREGIPLSGVDIHCHEGLLALVQRGFWTSFSSA